MSAMPPGWLEKTRYKGRRRTRALLIRTLR
jgi:hypothetical protein